VTGPTVRIKLDLGDYRPAVEDDDWRPIVYTLNAHHVTELSPAGDMVRDRRLERLTLDLENEQPDAWEETKPATLDLPTTVEGLEALAQLINHARDYLAQDARDYPQELTP